MNNDQDHRFHLDRIDDTTWTIIDTLRASDDTRRVQAALRAGDEVVHVRWYASTPLPRTYLTASDALDDFRRWASRSRRSTRPVPIPHFEPRR